MKRRALLLAASAGLLQASGVGAQRADDAGIAATGQVALTPPFASAPLVVADPEHRTQAQAALSPRLSRWWAPLASAALPGAGQALLRQDRWLPYLAIEAYAWFQYAASRADAQRQARAYRALARDVAQAPFGVSQEGDFEYYERMKHFSESGVYDLVPGDELEPEIDTLTSNGALWLLARRTYWTDPDAAPDRDSDPYRNALLFYTTRAVRPQFRYSWRNAQFEHDVFRRTIDRSNSAYRRSVEYLGAVLANHVLSTVDAYMTLRLERRPSATSPKGELELSATLPWPRAWSRPGTATR